MEYFSQKLIKDEELEKKIKFICSYNNSKCEFIDGHIINILKTNVSFIEPHKIIIRIKTYKLLLLYFDADNIFLYERTIQINLTKLEKLLCHIRKNQNVS